MSHQYTEVLCRTCRFYDAAENADTGLCRFYPPVIPPNVRAPFIGAQPGVTGESDWCGRWTQRGETITGREKSKKWGT